MTMPEPSLPTLEELILDESLREMWFEYLDGGWVQGTPIDPGVYQVATLEGQYVGLKEYVIRDGSVVDRLQGHREVPWVGFVWSKPLPPPPVFVEVEL